MTHMDLACIHWTGGTGMFAILRGEVALGLIILIVAQLVYELMSRRKR